MSVKKWLDVAKENVLERLKRVEAIGKRFKDKIDVVVVTQHHLDIHGHMNDDPYFYNPYFIDKKKNLYVPNFIKTLEPKYYSLGKSYSNWLGPLVKTVSYSPFWSDTGNKELCWLWLGDLATVTQSGTGGEDAIADLYKTWKANKVKECKDFESRAFANLWQDLVDWKLGEVLRAIETGQAEKKISTDGIDYIKAQIEKMDEHYRSAIAYPSQKNDFLVDYVEKLEVLKDHYKMSSKEKEIGKEIDEITESEEYKRQSKAKSAYDQWMNDLKEATPADLELHLPGDSDGVWERRTKKAAERLEKSGLPAKGKELLKQFPDAGGYTRRVRRIHNWLLEFMENPPGNIRTK